jgi:hypothetical protein
MQARRKVTISHRLKRTCQVQCVHISVIVTRARTCKLSASSCIPGGHSTRRPTLKELAEMQVTVKYIITYNLEVIEWVTGSRPWLTDIGL